MRGRVTERGARRFSSQMMGYAAQSRRRSRAARSPVECSDADLACAPLLEGYLQKTTRPPGVLGARRWKLYLCTLRGASLFYREVVVVYLSRQVGLLRGASLFYREVVVPKSTAGAGRLRTQSQPTPFGNTGFPTQCHTPGSSTACEVVVKFSSVDLLRSPTAGARGVSLVSDRPLPSDGEGPVLPPSPHARARQNH